MTKPNISAATDARLEEALNTLNYRLTLSNQKKLILNKFEQSLIYSINGGSFIIDPSLISFIQTLLSSNNEEYILIDRNKNPIFIQSLQQFQDDILERYMQSTREYLIDYKNLQKSRGSVKALIGE